MIKNIAIFLFGMIFFRQTGIAQTSHYLSLGPDLGIPTNSLGQSKLGVGGSLEYQLKFAAPVGIQLHVGYSSFTNKYISDSKVSFLPVRVGVVGFLVEDVIFVNADAGISHYYSPTTKTKQDGFTFGAGAGCRYKIAEKQFVQLSAYFNLHNFKKKETAQDFNYNWFNIRAAYGLNWGSAKQRRP